jgi:hypothetical protein
MKTVTFVNDDGETQNAKLIGGKTDGAGSSMREREPGKWMVGMVLVGMDCVWKWAGARAGAQEVVKVGEGFEGWVWRSNVGTWGISAQADSGEVMKYP